MHLSKTGKKASPNPQCFSFISQRNAQLRVLGQKEAEISYTFTKHSGRSPFDHQAKQKLEAHQEKSARYLLVF